MPYKFRFVDVTTNHVFECHLYCQQCVSQAAKSGERCKKRSCYGVPFCFIHLKAKKNLQIKESTIANAGKGLFAVASPVDYNRVIFKPGDIIIKYGGEVFSRREMEKRYGDKTAIYTVATHGDNVIDAACARGVAAHANHSATNPNAILSLRRTGVYLVARRAIRNNQEIFCDYGDEYRFNERGVSYTTKPCR